MGQSLCHLWGRKVGQGQVSPASRWGQQGSGPRSGPSSVAAEPEPGRPGTSASCPCRSIPYSGHLHTPQHTLPPAPLPIPYGPSQVFWAQSSLSWRRRLLERTQGGLDGTNHSGWQRSWRSWLHPPVMPLRTRRETRETNQPKEILPSPCAEAHTHRVSLTYCLCVYVLFSQAWWHGRDRMGLWHSNWASLGGGGSQTYGDEEPGGLLSMWTALQNLWLFLHLLVSENLVAVRGSSASASG